MRRTKEEAENTREEILNAAVAVFSDKGVAKSTLEDIARAAGVTRGAIYWHFTNKTEIFDALHERLHRPLVEMIMEDMSRDHPEPLVQLRDLCVKLFEDLERDERKRQTLTLFLAKCDYSGDLARCKTDYCEKKAEKMELFRRYFEKALQAGKLPPGAEPELLTQLTSCFMKGLLIEYLDGPESSALAKAAPRLIDLFFRGLGAR